MKWLIKLFKSKQQKNLERILSIHHGGIYKRIDENRELLEFIQQQKYPELLEKHYWVESWLQSQDGFLNDLAKSVPADAELLRFKAQEANSRYEGSLPYPRPCPVNRK